MAYGSEDDEEMYGPGQENMEMEMVESWWGDTTTLAKWGAKNVAMKAAIAVLNREIRKSKSTIKELPQSTASDVDGAIEKQISPAVKKNKQLVDEIYKLQTSLNDMVKNHEKKKMDLAKKERDLRSKIKATNEVHAILTVRKNEQS